MESQPMSTATLSKSQRKQLRKQMMERKQELMAKHGRADSGASPRSFTDVKPKLPADVKKPIPDAVASNRPRWTPPVPHRSITANTPPPVRHVPFSRSTPITRPVISDLDAAGPGPLTRAAAATERVARRALTLWRQRPWQESADPRRSESHRALAGVVRPLRVLGVVVAVGAVALGRTSRDLGASDVGSLVVLGMGLAMAVALLALAEVAKGLRTLLRSSAPRPERHSATAA